MALREILKCDTSVANQVQLQQASAAANDATDIPDESECQNECKKAKIDASSS